MHKGVILLVKENEKEHAIERVKNFMDVYGNDKVWDWYVIGGRWHQTLAPMYDKFMEEADKILVKTKGNLTYDEVKLKQPQLIQLWNYLGGKGKNPYSDHYNLPEEGDYYDIMPLSECLETVKKWSFDVMEKGNERLKDADDWLKKGDVSMYGHVLKCAGDIFQQNFCFECNVYNVETYDYSIPDDTTGYYAVMIDMHS